VAKELDYFEFVNSLRQLSRRIFTDVDPEQEMHKFYKALEEIRDTFFTQAEFSARFFQEEILEESAYLAGSSSRKLL
jgi:hypothetical protein